MRRSRKVAETRIPVQNQLAREAAFARTQQASRIQIEAISALATIRPVRELRAITREQIAHTY